MVDEGANALFEVQLANGARSVLSSALDGRGLAGAEYADVIHDPSSGRALVADASIGGLLAIDLATGARVALANDAAGGPRLVAPAGLVLDGLGNALVADAMRGALMVVDLASGARVLRSK